MHTAWGIGMEALLQLHLPDSRFLQLLLIFTVLFFQKFSLYTPKRVTDYQRRTTLSPNSRSHTVTCFCFTRFHHRVMSLPSRFFELSLLKSQDLFHLSLVSRSSTTPICSIFRMSSSLILSRGRSLTLRSNTLRNS